MVYPSLAFEERYWSFHNYKEACKRAMDDPEGFWGQEASRLDWFKTWDKVLEWKPPYARWFVGGLLNASWLCADQHLRTWRRSKVAIYWEGELGETRLLSYAILHREVCRFASVLRNLGVENGDRVALYLPMIPELPIFMLACARIGAIHTVIFSGFSAQALADRMNDTKAKVLVTADGGYRRGKVVSLKGIADKAVEMASSVEKAIVVKRTGEAVSMKGGRDFWLDDLLKGAVTSVDPVPVEATHPLFILYTSGTTGKPKGVVHSTGGYMVYNHSAYRWAFDIKEDSVYWCTADVGWVTGHSSIVYAPLVHGAALVMYEGAPDYPTIDRWWDIVEKYGVTIFYSSPTAIRMFMRYGEDWLKKHDFSSLKLLGSVGEPINPEAWLWYYKNIGRERCPIIDTWWQTETGGIMIAPTPGLDLAPLKPGSATFSLPGIDADVIDEQGNPTKAEERGHLVIKRPWPGMLMDIYGDSERYKSTYWSKFKGMFFTGDYAIKDREGYFWILGRSDEVIKVAGHRLGTAEIEDAVISHPSIAESAVTSKPDPVKGEAIIIFAILKAGFVPSADLKHEVAEHIRVKIGPIATPEEIYFVSKLPKTRSGKIMRRVLKAIATRGTIGDLSTLEDAASVDEIKKALEELKKEI